MNKYKKTLISLLLLSSSGIALAKNSSGDMTLTAQTLAGCQFGLPTEYNFGVVDYTEASKAVDFPANFAPHAEIPMDMYVQCTSGVPYSLTYTTEKRDVPTNENGVKSIEGIILNHIDGSSDFLLAYIYLKNESRMLHKTPLVNVGDSTAQIYNLLMGLQNPLSRGYMYPSAGVYVGESLLTLEF